MNHVALRIMIPERVRVRMFVPRLVARPMRINQVCWVLRPPPCIHIHHKCYFGTLEQNRFHPPRGRSFIRFAVTWLMRQGAYFGQVLLQAQPLNFAHFSIKKMVVCWTQLSSSEKGAMGQF